MKSLLITLLLFICGFCKGQTIGSFETNTTDSDKSESLVFTKFSAGFEQTISYTARCCWPTEQWFFVLGYKNGNWEFSKWMVHYKDRDKSQGNIKSIKQKKLRISSITIDSLLNYWKRNQFFSLNIDSLNCTEKRISDSKTELMGLSDACSDNFELIVNDKYRRIYSYAADQFQQSIPIKQREKFIQCRNKYFELMFKKKT